jgi:transposase
VVLDNLSSHKRADAREMIESAGASLWFLPAYSPDLNPIENAFSKLRQLYESAGHRTIDALWRSTQGLLDAITPSDARGFFKHAGNKNAT